MKLDLYDCQARLKPALLTGLPASLAIAAWFPDEKLAIAGLAFVLSSFGFCALLAQIGRDLGKAKEPWLFQQWGGKPTTVKLRYGGTSLDWVTHARIHGTLSNAVGIPAPTKDGEAADPQNADQVYEAFATFLREATRDKEKYRLVYAENVNYGFRRNLWGLKPIGIGIAALGTVAAAIPLERAFGTAGSAPGIAIAATTLNALLLVIWIFWVTPNWVRTAAEAYAQRLLEACGSLEASSAKQDAKSIPTELTKAK